MNVERYLIERYLTKMRCRHCRGGGRNGRFKCRICNGTGSSRRFDKLLKAATTGLSH